MNIYGIFVVLAMILSSLYIHFQFNFKLPLVFVKAWKNKLFHTLILINILFVSFIIGAKIAFVFFHKQNASVFTGFSTVGGIFFVLIATITYGIQQKINILKLLDILSFAFLLSYGVVRLGCHLSKDGCWGKANEKFISINEGNKILLKQPTNHLIYKIFPTFLLANTYADNQQNLGDTCITNNQHTSFCYFSTPLYPTSLIAFFLCVSYFFVINIFYFYNKKKIKKGIFAFINLVFFIIQYSFINHFLK